ncbi:ComF family protein [Mesorhizobium sp. YIM 152430]|uniref:ComF family protein n=1 Tax=Mesorhizobium sp. YIM 152430 TaxID=3031761 RepID=UPI0023DAB1BE|nr:ComF family protein [Mesorhizobium sp. YIM 152430]MDF1599197.1 ComF family protein [Mesorhizobium sp. YIM 152430]
MKSLVVERLGKIKSAGTIAGQIAGRMIFPPTCLGCRRIVAAGGTMCVSCWGDIHFLDEPWCAVSGVPFAFDMGAGAISPAVMASPPAYDRARAAVAYEGAARRLAQSLKYQDRTDLAPWLAGWMVRAGRDILDRADLIVPVPLHRQRFFTRRFNQSAELARAIASKTGRPLAADAVIRVKKTRQQVGLKAKERQDNVRAAFRVPEGSKALISGKHVCIVDDVYTTGATVSALAGCLRRAGAAEISVLTFARVLPGDFRRSGDFRHARPEPI